MADKWTPWLRMQRGAEKAVAAQPPRIRAPADGTPEAYTGVAEYFRGKPAAQPEPKMRVTPEMQDHYSQAQANFDRYMAEQALKNQATQEVQAQQAAMAEAAALQAQGYKRFRGR